MVHPISPHRSIDCSLAAFAGSSAREMDCRPPKMYTVWLPAETYVCVCVPVTDGFTVPSPQSIVYVPVAGMVMDSSGVVVSQVVTNVDATVIG